jgi:hypothetical protein
MQHIGFLETERVKMGKRTIFLCYLAMMAFLLPAALATADTITLFEEFEGTTVGTSANPLTYVEGLHGQGLMMTGTDFSLRYNSLFFPSSGSMEAYVKPLSWDIPTRTHLSFLTTAPDYGIINDSDLIVRFNPSGSSVLNQSSLMLEMRSPNEPNSPDKSAGLGPATANYGVGIGLNEWVAIGVSWGSQGMKTYVNGALVSSSGDWTGELADVPVYLGMNNEVRNYWNRAFYGVVDDLRVSSVQGDITYTNPNTPATPEPSSLLLLGGPLVAMLAAARRKAKAKAASTTSSVS